MDKNNTDNSKGNTSSIEEKELTIIIPCYKAEKTLPLLLRSLDAQTEQNFSVVLSVDRVSPQETRVYNKIKKEKHPYKVSVLMHDKLGAGGNRQYALDTITSTYVAFVDSDDIVYPRYAEVLLRGIKTIKGNVLATGIKRELPDGAFVDILPSSQTRSCLTWLHGKVYLVEFLRSKNIRFDSDLRVDEDGLFNSMVALYNPVKGVDEITYLWRYNTSSLTVRKDRIEDNLVSSIMSIAKTIVETYMRDKSKITDTFIVTKVTMLYNVYEEALLRGLTISDRIRPYIVAIDKVIDIVALVNEHPELFGGIQQLGTVDGKSVWYKESLLEFIKHMEVRDNEGIR